MAEARKIAAILVADVVGYGRLAESRLGSDASAAAGSLCASPRNSFAWLCLHLPARGGMNSGANDEAVGIVSPLYREQLAIPYPFLPCWPSWANRTRPDPKTRLASRSTRASRCGVFATGRERRRPAQRHAQCGRAAGITISPRLRARRVASSRLFAGMVCAVPSAQYPRLLSAMSLSLCSASPESAKICRKIETIASVKQEYVLPLFLGLLKPRVSIERQRWAKECKQSCQRRRHVSIRRFFIPNGCNPLISHVSKNKR